jgi:hypothetical protein
MGTKEQDYLISFMKALRNSDTVICRLTNVGESTFEGTEELYKEIQKLWYNMYGNRVKNANKSNPVWTGKCPRCGAMVIKRENYEFCANMHCKAPIYWE